MSASANRLAREKSPYLLQHAHNPVDWFPWGDEAFALARSRDCPVFLSIGYSTCHWCHVMERESFEDEAVAALMNRAFVCVKVDREERPDVDHVYMTACQMMTGSGGWPLTLLLTPGDRRPFFAATYIPPAAMRDFIPRIEAAWRDQREGIVHDAGRVADALGRAMQADASPVDGLEVMRSACRELSARHDSTHGGFGARPKFPSPHTLLFLLHYWKRTGDGDALAMVERTLERMRRGGICDQVGFGFHRYSTDAHWLVPHFEKMLYDQALMLMAYTDACQATGREEFATAAVEIAEYVMRDLSSPDGGFYSAEDADSEGVEGKFYVWTRAELVGVLGEGDAAIAAAYFGATDEGNFLEEATGHRTGANILHLPRPAGEAARALGMDPHDLRARMADIRTRLLHARSARVRPRLDDKVLADWNGLMIAALSRSGRVLNRPDHVERAMRAAEFIALNMSRPDGRLFHRHRDGADIDGMLDDYAFLAWGLIELYEATFDERYLERAIAHMRFVLDNFRDEDSGGFFMTSGGADPLLARPREVYDGALPSGNSVAALNLVRLSRFTGDMDFDRSSRDVVEAFGAQVLRAPMAHCALLLAVDFTLGPSFEIVISGRRGADDVVAMTTALASVYQPNCVVLFRPVDNPGVVERIAPYAKGQVALDGGRASAYVCRQFACHRPTTDAAEMLRLLSG